YLHACGAPPHLHSFPTRRSSDLLDEHGSPGCALGDLFTDRHAVDGLPEGDMASDPLHLVALHASEVVPADRRIGEGRLPMEASRSEEHTSELQSRENLVCRLLLE